MPSCGSLALAGRASEEAGHSLTPATPASTPPALPTVCRNEKMYPAAERQTGILIIRVDAPIYYANVEVRLRGPPFNLGA